MGWKNYRDRAQSLKASEARRIGKVWYENIARSSTFRWTPPETKRILLKTKKFVNACLQRWPEMI